MKKLQLLTTIMIIMISSVITITSACAESPNEMSILDIHEGRYMATLPNVKNNMLNVLEDKKAMVEEEKRKARLQQQKIKEQKEKEAAIQLEEVCPASDFLYHGVVHWEDYKWTWYSEYVLPGGGLDIPGRHVDENGYICDENEYICLASSGVSKGTVIRTPFGKYGKVYDCGCAIGTFDVYVSW